MGTVKAYRTSDWYEFERRDELDRLIYRYGNNHAVPTKIALDFVLDMDKETFGGLTEILDRLDAYEKTRLEPEAVRTAVMLWGGNAEVAGLHLQGL